ncbi:hypothetical protein Tco_0868316, partial [Tanacetum coccineum]
MEANTNNIEYRHSGRPVKKTRLDYSTTRTSTETSDIAIGRSGRPKNAKNKTYTQPIKHKSERMKLKKMENADGETNNNFVGISNEYIDHGNPNFPCESCDAQLWQAESMIGNTHSTSGSFSLCCGRGKVKLGNEIHNPPKLLMDLICGNHPKSSNFIDNIRHYNSMFSFTSIGAKQDTSVNQGHGAYCYRIQGQNYHRMGTLLPDEGKPPVFAQLYIYDTDNEIQHRIKCVSNDPSASTTNNEIDHDLTVELCDMLDAINPLVAQFRMAGERLVIATEENKYKLRLIIGTRMRDCRQYNLPTAFEVAALIVGDIDSTTNDRDIILHMQEGGLKRVSELHPSYLALQYPL